MTKQLQIGSRSSGTLLSEDIAKVLADDMEAMGLESEPLYAELRHIETAEDNEHAGEALNDAMDRLTEFVPEYCYYGMNEGDGANLGVWISRDSIDDDIWDGNLVKVSDLSEVEEDYEGNVLLVNDHGNMTLYNVKYDEEGNLVTEEIWGVV